MTSWLRSQPSCQRFRIVAYSASAAIPSPGIVAVVLPSVMSPKSHGIFATGDSIGDASPLDVRRYRLLMGFMKVGGVAARTAVRERYRMRTLATDPRTQVIASSEAAATLRRDFAANLLQVQQTKTIDSSQGCNKGERALPEIHTDKLAAVLRFASRGHSG
jgi:hypothetical protein